MPSPFNVPDEYVQGLLNSGQAFWRSFFTQGQHETTLPGLPQLSLLLGPAQSYWHRQISLWTGMMTSPAADSAAPIVEVEQGDRRFRGEPWRDSPWHNLLKQSYLVNARFLRDMIEAADLDDKAKHKLRFYGRQFIDSTSPANFPLLNPEVIQLAIDSKGESAMSGLNNLLADLKIGRISITDETAFEVGRNVAVSKGSVVFENELFQLIQYAALTDQVAARPLLIVPPCINKFYILDLQPGNSFVRFACEQGMTVFLVSWRNPGAEQGATSWDDYLQSGAMKAIETALAISGADKVNAVGWCVGGTILSSALAVLRANGDNSVASLTLLTTMLDFCDPGDLGAFIDEHGVAQRERAIGDGGIYPGRELGFVFQTLRANDLIWPYVVSNYLKGKTPEAFDLLYWNADSTNLPGPMYTWYLRNMYLENNLCVANRLTMCGTPVDLGRIDVPSYVLATQEDHIVPWRGAYRTTQLLGGRTQFVLGASGHIAGVINPASKNKRSYWIGGKEGAEPDQWLASAKAVPGSWWTHWMQWLKAHAGKSVPSRKRLGNLKFKPIEPAPGRYVVDRGD